MNHDLAPRECVVCMFVLYSSKNHICECICVCVYEFTTLFLFPRALLQHCRALKSLYTLGKSNFFQELMATLALLQPSQKFCSRSRCSFSFSLRVVLSLFLKQPYTFETTHTATSQLAHPAGLGSLLNCYILCVYVRILRISSRFSHIYSSSQV